MKNAVPGIFHTMIALAFAATAWWADGQGAEHRVIDAADTNEVDRSLAELRARMDAITNNGGFAAIAIGESRSVPVAAEKAKVAAKTELVFMAHTEYAKLMKDVVERPDNAGGRPRQVADRVVVWPAGAFCVRNYSNDICRAWALAEMNPRWILAHEELAWRDGVARTNMTPREHIESSARFRQLKEAADRYEKWIRTSGGEMRSAPPK